MTMPPRRTPDELGEFLEAYDEYLAGKRSYDDIPVLGGNGRKLGDMRINPWSKASEPEPERPKWELYGDGDRENPSVYRMRIQGGWLYRAGKNSPVFVPDR